MEVLFLLSKEPVFISGLFLILLKSDVVSKDDTLPYVLSFFALLLIAFWVTTPVTRQKMSHQI